MSSAILDNPSQETHDEIMQLLYQTKRLKLSGNDTPVKFTPMKKEENLKDQLMYIFPSLEESTITNSISDSLELSINNVSKILPKPPAEFNRFRNRRCNFSDMEADILQEDLPKRKVAEKPITSDNVNSKEDLKKFIYNMLIPRKDQIKAQKITEIKLMKIIETSQKDFHDLNKTLGVVNKCLGEAEKQNNELTDTLNLRKKDKQFLEGEIKQVSFKNNYYNKVIKEDLSFNA